jgi:TetR/AcrR family transcriptional regulator, lmrAB and yxaGH operons repressor
VPTRLTDDDLIERLSILFRDRGFDGTSLADIATATGLQKSSLYHRFPGGKQQMAAEVAGRVSAHFAADVLAPLHDERPARERVAAVARNLATFYEQGWRPCALDALSRGDVGAPASEALANAARGWISAFASIAREAGATRAAADAQARDAVASIQGGLILARVTHDNTGFKRALRRLPETLLDG